MRRTIVWSFVVLSYVMLPILRCSNRFFVAEKHAVDLCNVWRSWVWTVQGHRFGQKQMYVVVYRWMRAYVNVAPNGHKKQSPLITQREDLRRYCRHDITPSLPAYVSFVSHFVLQSRVFTHFGTLVELGTEDGGRPFLSLLFPSLRSAFSLNVKKGKGSRFV